jgi:hypothetical protein
VAQLFSLGGMTHHEIMRALLFTVCLAIVGCAGCKQKDPAYLVLPGRHMTEVQVLSQATGVFHPRPEQSQFHVTFKDGVWEVSCESNHVTRVLTIRDADCVILQTNQP